MPECDGQVRFDPFRSAVLSFVGGAAAATRRSPRAEPAADGEALRAPGSATGAALATAESLLAAPGDPQAELGRRLLAWAAHPALAGTTTGSALAAYTGSWPDAARQAALAAGTTRSQHVSERRSHADGGALARLLPVALAVPERIAVQRTAARLSALTHWDAEAETCGAVLCLWLREALRGRELARAWAKALTKARIDVERGALAPDTPGPLHPGDPLWDRLFAAGEQPPQQPLPGGAAHQLAAVAWCCLGAGSADEAVAAAGRLVGPRRKGAREGARNLAVLAGGVAGAFGPGLPPERTDRLPDRRQLADLAARLRQLRHDLVYASGLPPFALREVDDRLYVGSHPLTELDVLELARRGICRVLDLREKDEYGKAERHGQEAVAALARNGIERCHVPIPEAGAPTAEDLDRACAFLRRAMASGGTARVLIHCRAGIERTGAILIGFLASARRVPLAPILDELTERRVPVRPLPHQLAAVDRWLRARPA